MKNNVLAPKFPDTITVVFTEEDRQNADVYTNNVGCLLHTALTRMGYKNHSVGAYGEVHINNNTVAYKPATEDAFNIDLVEDDNATERPYYLPSVVGMTLELFRVR
jgi:hypothetical protein